MQEVTSELILNAAPEEPEMIPADQCAVWNTVDFDCTERSDCVQQYASSIHLTRSTLIDWIWL